MAAALDQWSNEHDRANIIIKWSARPTTYLSNHPSIHSSSKYYIILCCIVCARVFFCSQFVTCKDTEGKQPKERKRITYARWINENYYTKRWQYSNAMNACTLYISQTGFETKRNNPENIVRRITMQPMLVCKESDSAWYLMFDALSPLYLSLLPSEYNFLTTLARTQHICMRVYPCVRIAALFGSVRFGSVNQ